MTPTLVREYKKLQRRVSRETNIFKGFNRIGIKIILSVRRINKDEILYTINLRLYVYKHIWGMQNEIL